jgi:geranylgeranyl diphosphate synthase, type II
LGEAYQVADDIRDVLADPALLGKPVGQDTALGRPSSARELGLGGALDYYEALVNRVVASIPQCDGVLALQSLVREEAERLVPSTWVHESHELHSRSAPTSNVSGTLDAATSATAKMSHSIR